MGMTDASVLNESLFRAVDRIYLLAKKKKFTIATLSKAAGKPFQSFQNWKSRKHPPDLHNLHAFAEIVGLAVRVQLYNPSVDSGIDGGDSMGLSATERRIVGMLRRMTPEEQRTALEAVADVMDPNEPVAEIERSARSRLD